MEVINIKNFEYYNKLFLNSKKYSNSYKDLLYYKLGIWPDVLNLVRDQSKILDIGCGPGQFAKMLSDSNKQITYLGVDFSDVAIKKCMDLKLPDNYSFLLGDILDINNFHNIIDIFNPTNFICLEVLEHIDNDLQIVLNIPTGRDVIFCVPNFTDPGHVRCFKNIDEVFNRYRSLIDIKYYKEYGDTYKFYLCYGIRSQNTKYN